LPSGTELFFLFPKSVNQKQVFNLDTFCHTVLKSRFPLADKVIICQIIKTKHTFIRERCVKERNSRPATAASKDAGSELPIALPEREKKPAKCTD